MVSIVIPTYNRAETIRRSLLSVIKQSYKDIEVIVVDDFSSDNTYDIVSSIDDTRVIYYRLQKNSGACVARNEGIRLSKGEYIAFQDSDDAWLPEKLEIQMNTMIKYNADVCFSKFRRHGYGSADSEFPNLQEGIIPFETLLFQSYVSTQTIIAKRKVFNSFIFDPQMSRRQDYDWTIRAAQKFKFCFCSDVLVDVYLQNDSLTNLSHKKYYENYEMLRKKYKDLRIKYPEYDDYLLRKIAIHKTHAGINAYDEYKTIYHHNRTVKNYALMRSAQVGLLKYVCYIRNKIRHKIN